MPSYDIRLYGSAEEQLNELGPQESQRVKSAIKDLAKNRNPPQSGNVTKLDISNELYRMKVGSNRVIFGRYKRFLIVVRVAYRGDRVYDKLEHDQEVFEEAKQVFAQTLA